MSSMNPSDWRIVMLIDGTDASGKLTYQHVYQHSDGRKAYVGPGYCSDPDLEWILFKRNRENKLWNRRQAKRGKISLYIVSAIWLIILSQAAFAITSKGVLVFLSVLGYWLTQLGGVGFFNNFRDLIIRSPNLQSEKKLLHFLIVIGFIYCGHWLIHIGKLHSLSIVFLQIPLLWFGLFMGIVKATLDKWQKQEF